MEKYNEMREDGALFSWAESVEFAERAVQANLRDQTAKAKRLGKKEGLQEGLRTLLKTQIAHKYGIKDRWVEMLSDEQIEDAVILILECETYNALKERLKHITAK